MKKIYISGEVSANLRLNGTVDVTDHTRAKENFDNAERKLNAAGFAAVSIFNNGLGTDNTWEEHCAANILALLKCDGVIMLPGWEFSRGARIEKAVALHAGIPVVGPDEVLAEVKTPSVDDVILKLKEII